MSRLGDALINRDFARLWYGQAVSTIGDFVFTTTLVLWIATKLGPGKSWAPFAVSGVMLAVSGAIFLIGPAAGVFVDRWNRRHTMLATEAIRAVLVGVLAAVAFLPTHDLPIGAWLALIYAVVFLVNGIGQFFGPSRMATISDIVEGDALRAKAAGIGQATTATAAIIGPPLAAPLLFTVGMQWALLLNAASYVVSYFAIRSVRKVDTSGADHGADSNLRREFVEGLRFFAGNRFLVALTTIAVIASMGTGAIGTLDVFFVTENLHAAPRLFGFISTAMGLGSVAGALLAGRVVRRIGAKATVSAGLMVAGGFFMLYARQTMFLPAIVLVVAFSIPVTMLNTAISPILLHVTPRDYLGRVIAVFSPINELSQMLSAVLAGWLASSVLLNFHANVGGLHFSRIDTIFTASGLLLALAGVYGVFSLPGPDTSVPDSLTAAEATA